MGKDAKGASAPVIYTPLCPICGQEVDETQPGTYRVLPADVTVAYLVHQRTGIVHTYTAVDRVHIIRLAGKQTAFVRHDLDRRAVAKAGARLLHDWCYQMIGRLSEDLVLDARKVHHVVNVVESTFEPTEGTVVRSVNGPYADSEGRWTCDEPAAQRAPGPTLGSYFERLPLEVRRLILDAHSARKLLVLGVGSWMTEERRGCGTTPSRLVVDRLKVHDHKKVVIDLIRLGGRKYVKSLSNLAVDKVASPARVLEEEMPPPKRQSKKARIKAEKKQNLRRKQAEAELDDRARGHILYGLENKNYLAVMSDGVGVVNLAFEEVGPGQGPRWILPNDTALSERGVAQLRLANLNGFYIVSDYAKVRALSTLEQRTGVEPYFTPAARGPYSRDMELYAVGSSIVDRIRPSRASKKVAFNDPADFFTRATYMRMSDIRKITVEMCVDRPVGVESIIVSTEADLEYEDGLLVPGVADTNPYPVDYVVEKDPQGNNRPMNPSLTARDRYRPRKKELFLVRERVMQRAHVPFCRKLGDSNSTTRVKYVKRMFRHSPYTLFQFDVEGEWLPNLPQLPSADRLVEETIFENVKGIWWADTPARCPMHFGIVQSTGNRVTLSS